MVRKNIDARNCASALLTELVCWPDEQRGVPQKPMPGQTRR
jgi:ribosomal protein L35AE/L33A